MRPQVKVIIALMFIAVVFGGVYLFLKEPKIEKSLIIKSLIQKKVPVKVKITLDQVFAREAEAQESDELITLITTGDVIPVRAVNSQVLKNKDFNWPYLKTAYITSSADITLVNLEAPLIKNCPTTLEGFIFCGDYRNVEGLIFAGVDVATLANNHVGNYGTEGIDETAKLLRSKGIESVKATETVYKNAKGVKFAFLAFNLLGVEPNKDLISGQIKAAGKAADIVVVAFHWGEEYTAFPSDLQVEIAHLAINSGAKLVIGNHPHWVQAVEIYKNGFITYAHGNFVFDQMWSEKTRTGVIGRYKFLGNDLIDVKFIPIFIEDYGQPIPMLEDKASQVLEEMKADSVELAR